MNLALAQRSTRLQPTLTPLSEKVEEAIDFLREHEPREGYFVGFSGGKDSIVTLELCRMAGVKHQVYYSATGIDAPEVVRFIRQEYPRVTWLRPKMSFWEGIRKKDPPLRGQRWCCDVLKKDPSKLIPLTQRIMGIRAEESNMRASKPRIELRTGGIIHFKPIFQWTEWHVWEFINQHKLPYPSLYDDGFNRIGCIVCPNICSKNMVQVNRNRERWPQAYKLFEKTVADWFEVKRTDPRKVQKHATAQEYLEAWFRGFD